MTSSASDVAAPSADGRADRLGDRRIAVALAYTALLVCFVITNFTNDVILQKVRLVLGKKPDWPEPALRHMRFVASDHYTQYLLASVKDAAFFVCLVVLGFLIRTAAMSLWPAIKQRTLWINPLIGFCIASIFILQIQTAGMGETYAQVSIDPFLQHTGMYYRRILMPVLAHDLHLAGVLYGFFYWGVVLIVLALVSIYVGTKGLTLSKLELASLCTVGSFATGLGLPGYPELLVLGFTLLAMLDFEHRGRAGISQLVLFGLALLTHESAAVLSFGVMALCLFDRRFLIHFLALLSLYVLIWLLSFSFDVQAAARTQTVVIANNAMQYQGNLPHALLSIPMAYKFMLIVAAAAVALLAVAGDYRKAAFIVLAIAGGAATTYVAVDYSRVVSFGTFGVIVALPVVLTRLSQRQRLGLALANLMTPTIYISIHAGIWPYRGLYGLVLARVFHLHV